MLLNLSYPKVIYTQTTAPSGANAGALWWDTDDALLYYYTGSAWLQISSSADAGGWESAVSQLMLEVLRLSAEGTLTAPDYDSLFVDYFSDADGQDGTIDTGNTTGIYANGTYTNKNLGAPSTNGHGVSLASAAGTVTAKRGNKITVKTADVYLRSVTKDTQNTATKCYLTDASKTILETATFSGDVATFSGTTMSASTIYYILTDNEGGNYADEYGAASTPISNTDIEWNGYWDGSSDDTNYLTAITSIDVSTSFTMANKLIRTNNQALTFSPAYLLIHSKDKTLTGTGALTYDVSFDGGSTWDSTGNSFDVKTAVTDGSAKNMTIKLNLNGTGAGNVAGVKDYEVVLWSS